jgi:hypothetical protein
MAAVAADDSRDPEVLKTAALEKMALDYKADASGPLRDDQSDTLRHIDLRIARSSPE